MALASIEPVPDMSKARLTIQYDGPALADHSMDVRELAPALLSIGQLFDAANTALNGESTRVSVNVTAYDKGSFGIDIELVQSIINKGIAILSGQEMTAAIHLKDLIIGGVVVGGGLVWLIKRLRGRKPDKIERLPNGSVRLVLGDERIDVSIKLLRLFQDLNVRDALERVVAKPLNHPGINSVTFLSDRQRIVDINKDEATAFEAPEVEEQKINEGKSRSAYSIVSLAFKDDNKWRLHDGNNEIRATIRDTDFLHQVDTNAVSFAKGDVLICDVSFEQKQSKGSLRTEYFVDRVVEHRPAPRQLVFRIDDIIGP